MKNIDWALIFKIAPWVLFLFSSWMFFISFGKSRERKRKVAELEKKVAELDNSLKQVAGTLVKDTASLNTQVAQLDQQVNNQKATIEFLKEKGNKKDAMELIRYNRCAEKMSRTIPGYYQAWAQYMDEVRREEEEENSGIKRFLGSIVKLLSGEKPQKTDGQEKIADSESGDKLLESSPKE